MEAVMRLFSVLGLVLLLSGCGTLVGAGAGGYAGNQFGKGSGKTAATAAGVVGGGLLGHAVTGD
jgi:osmotically inducible lipoprotein OsmB